MRDQALGSSTVTLATRTLIDHGMSAWIDAFATRASAVRGPMAIAAARARTLAPRPSELIGLLATLVSNRRTPEVHA